MGMRPPRSASQVRDQRWAGLMQSNIGPDRWKMTCPKCRVESTDWMVVRMAGHLHAYCRRCGHTSRGD